MGEGQHLALQHGLARHTWRPRTLSWPPPGRPRGLSPAPVLRGGGTAPCASAWTCAPHLATTHAILAAPGQAPRSIACPRVARGWDSTLRFSMDLRATPGDHAR